MELKYLLQQEYLRILHAQIEVVGNARRSLSRAQEGGEQERSSDNNVCKKTKSVFVHMFPIVRQAPLLTRVSVDSQRISLFCRKV